MTLKRFRLVAAAAGWSCALSLLAGCATQPVPETGDFAMKVSALTGTCGSASTNSPLGEIRSFKLIVREPNDQGVLSTIATMDSSFNGSSKSITFTGIPAGSPREVTLLGYTQDNKPAWYARKTALTINKLETQTVDVTLMAAEGFTCVGPEAGVSKLAFPVVTRIASDKILITGGFADEVVDGADLKLTLPQSQAWLFDPSKGTFTDAGQLAAPRGAHSAIYLPKSGKILIAGGATEMKVKADGSAPPTWNAANAVNPRWEVCALDANNQLQCSTDTTIQDNVKPRVMPNLMLLTADYVVASGGAPWPTVDSQDFRCADLFDPTLATQVDGGKGGFVKLKAGALCMNGSRAGAAMAPFTLPTEAGTLHYLVWGGNQSISASGVSSAPGKVVESFLESSNLGDGRFDDTYTLLGTDGKPATEYSEATGSLFFPFSARSGDARRRLQGRALCGHRRRALERRRLGQAEQGRRVAADGQRREKDHCDPEDAGSGGRRVLPQRDGDGRSRGGQRRFDRPEGRRRDADRLCAERGRSLWPARRRRYAAGRGRCVCAARGAGVAEAQQRLHPVVWRRGRF